MQLEEVAEAWGAVDTNQDAILHSGAEAHSKAVRAGAGSVIGWPRVEDEASALPEDVGSASCKCKEKGSHQGTESRAARGRHTVETPVGRKQAPHASTWRLRGMTSKASNGGCHPELKMQAK